MPIPSTSSIPKDALCQLSEPHPREGNVHPPAYRYGMSYQTSLSSLDIAYFSQV